MAPPGTSSQWDNILKLCKHVIVTAIFRQVSIQVNSGKNMYCAIYRSPKRDQTYLYVEKKDDFSRVPAELLQGFGQPTLAMLLPLDGSKRLVNADLNKVKMSLEEQGYYLQVPPPIENLLVSHSGKDKEN